MKRDKMPLRGVVLATCEELDKIEQINPVPYELIETNARAEPGGPPVGVYYDWDLTWIPDALAKIRGKDAEMELIKVKGYEELWEMPDAPIHLRYW